jgi:hypothetical protein
VDGVLGQSWLVRHDYLLDYRKNQVVLDEVPPGRGLTLALHSADGRPSLSATVDGRRTELILDSGTATVVLFNCAPQPRLRETLLTNGDTAPAGKATIRIALPGEGERTMPALCATTQRAPGLLPANAFAGIFISNRDGYLRLIR